MRSPTGERPPRTTPWARSAASPLALALGVLLGLLAACGSDLESRPGAEALQVGDTSMVSSRNPELRALAAALLPELTARSGLPLLHPVRVEERSRGELEGYLRAKLQEELPADEADWIITSYALLGLAPAGLDLESLLLSVYTEQVAGFYDPDSTTLFVMDDQPIEALESVLLHELVHAVQDQSHPLDSLTSRALGNDRQTAAHAAIEGHATLVMMEYLLEEARGEAIDVDQLPDFSLMMESTMAALEDEYPALASAPRVLQESLLFPYLRGAGFVQDLWRREGRGTAPFGRWLPISTERVTDVGWLDGGPPPPPLSLDLSPEEEWTAVYSNSLGQLETRVFVETHGGEDAADAADGWAGDRFVLLQGEGATRSLVWVVAFDDVPSRDRFMEAVGAQVTRLGPTAAISVGEVSDVPLTVLTIGGGELAGLRVQAAESSPSFGAVN